MVTVTFMEAWDRDLVVHLSDGRTLHENAGSDRGVREGKRPRHVGNDMHPVWLGPRHDSETWQEALLKHWRYDDLVPHIEAYLT